MTRNKEVGIVVKDRMRPYFLTYLYHLQGLVIFGREEIRRLKLGFIGLMLIKVMFIRLINFRMKQRKLYISWKQIIFTYMKF